MIRPPGATYCISGDGDMLDAVCLAIYGREDMVVSVLEANLGLATRGPVLPSGVRIQLPVPSSSPTVAAIRLWD